MHIRRRELAAARAFSAVAGALPWGVGQYRLASPYADRNRWPKGFVADQQTSSGARLRLDLSDRTQLIAFLLRDYGPTLTRYVDRRLPHAGTFFDVGGHVGMMSFAMAAIRPDVMIHAFDPNLTNVGRWRHNHTLNPSERV
jgi:hypothetical protein